MKADGDVLGSDMTVESNVPRKRVSLRWSFLALSGIAFVGVAWLVVGLFGVRARANDSLDGVDAVFVLGPATPSRIAKAENIVSEAGGQIPLIVSKPQGGPCYVSPRICVTPKPATTAGEMDALRREAEQLGFRHPAIVTFTPHVARARYIAQRCYGQPVSVVGVPADLGLAGTAYQLVYQTVGFLKAIFLPC